MTVCVVAVCAIVLEHGSFDAVASLMYVSRSHLFQNLLHDLRAWSGCTALRLGANLIVPNTFQSCSVIQSTQAALFFAVSHVIAAFSFAAIYPWQAKAVENGSGLAKSGEISIIT